MDISTVAFLDELSKIAEEARENVTKERLLRAGKAGLAAAGGFGLGWGAGNLLADRVLPNLLQRHIPHPTPAQLQKGMMLAGGLGLMGSLASDYMKHRFSKYVAEGDKEPRDMLMGHEKLNPEPYRGET